VQCQLVFTDDGLHALAAEAIRKKTGARGLRSIVVRPGPSLRPAPPSLYTPSRCASNRIRAQERLLLAAMYDVPQSDIHTVVVDAAVVRGEVPARYYRGGERVAAAGGRHGRERDEEHEVAERAGGQ
jgi:ATP-dependent protease Clp ATPase subunit